MILRRFFSRMLVAVMASTQSLAPVMAEPSVSDVAPRVLNETIINSDQKISAVFQLSRTWGRLPAGTRMVGMPRTKNGGLHVCVEVLVMPGKLPIRTEPGHCIAQAVPASGAIVERAPSGTVMVPQAQPFHLYDIPTSWTGDHRPGGGH